MIGFLLAYPIVPIRAVPTSYFPIGRNVKFGRDLSQTPITVLHGGPISVLPRSFSKKSCTVGVIFQETEDSRGGFLVLAESRTPCSPCPPGHFPFRGGHFPVLAESWGDSRRGGVRCDGGRNGAWAVFRRIK
jgi:hypothetical protein